MPTRTRRIGAGRRDIAAVPDRNRGRARRDELVLTAEQQTTLRALGFGPDAPPRDFTDPVVRAAFVQALRDSGALPPDPHGFVSPVFGEALRAS